MADGREQTCAALHPTLMVRCILKDSPHVTGKGGGPVHLFSVAWEGRERATDDARDST